MYQILRCSVSSKYNRTDGRYVEFLFRPIYEVNTAIAYGVGAITTPFMTLGAFQPGATISFGIAGVLAGGSYLYARKAKPLIQRQLKLKLNKKEFMDCQTLREINSLEARITNDKFVDPRHNFMGYGFEWGSEHANRIYQVMNMDSKLTDIKLPFFIRGLTNAHQHETEELGGKPFIHAVGDETEIKVVEDTYFGHTLISGNIGTGKTTLLRLLSLNAIHMGAKESSARFNVNEQQSNSKHDGKTKNNNKVIVVIDPKNDTDWKESIKQEMEHLGYGDRFFSVHPAAQSESCRIPLLKNFVRVSEIADRVAPLMGTSGGSKTFEDFAYEQITFVAAGMEYIGTPIRLTSIQKALSSGKIAFCEKVLRVFFERTLGQDYEIRLNMAEYMKKGVEPWQVMSEYYKARLSETNENAAILGIIQLIEHPSEHFIKMITSLRPVLTALTSKPMDDLFSPIDDPESEDERRIVDLDNLMEKGGCLYISLDSMTDNKTAGFLARLVMAEIAAVSGRRYNNNDKKASRVAVFLDEAHAALENNDSLLNLLAVGRASSIELYLATQTISDIAAKTDEPTANRVLGLCNNFISFRTTDPKTQEYVAAQFSKTAITKVQNQSASGASSSESIFSFNSMHGERSAKEMDESFPMGLMGDLPKLQYIARLADGRKLKMRLPIVINSKPEERAKWL